MTVYISSNSLTSDCSIVTLSTLGTKLGVTFDAATNSSDYLSGTWHFIGGENTDRTQYGSRIIVNESGSTHDLRLTRYYDTSFDVGAWAKAHISDNTILINDVYLEEA